MNLLATIRSYGIKPDTPTATAKSIRLVNSISLLTIGMSVMVFIVSIPFGWLQEALILLALFLPSGVLPLYLNKRGKCVAARIYYLVSSYLFIFGMAITFGRELHFHYFLIGGIGMPMLFLSNEPGKLKFYLSGVAVVLWAYLEWHFTQWGPFVFFDHQTTHYTRIFNDFLIFITVFSIVFFFISEHSKHLKELVFTSEKIERKNKELESFAHTVSHDLKGPIHNITTLLTVLKLEHGKKLPPDAQEMLDLMEESTSNSIELINSILAYSKAGGEEGLNLERVPLKEVVTEVIHKIAPPQSMTVEYDQLSSEIFGSRTQIEQVLTNLIGNAFKYNDKPLGKIKITESRLTNGFIEIRVKDNGPGIRKEHRSSVFELFHTAHGLEREDSTGIGLAIVKKLVENNQGRVGLESEPGQGATFWFTWPQQRNLA